MADLSTALCLVTREGNLNNLGLQIGTEAATVEFTVAVVSLHVDSLFEFIRDITLLY